MEDNICLNCKYCDGYRQQANNDFYTEYRCNHSHRVLPSYFELMYKTCNNFVQNDDIKAIDK